MSQPSQINPLGKELPLACKITERVSLLALLVSAVAIMAISLVFVYAPPGSPIFSPLFWSPVVVGNISLISFVVFSCLRYKLYLLTKQSALKNEFSPQDPEIKTVHPPGDSNSTSLFDDNNATTVIFPILKASSSSSSKDETSKQSAKENKNHVPLLDSTLLAKHSALSINPKSTSSSIAEKQDLSYKSEESTREESEKNVEENSKPVLITQNQSKDLSINVHASKKSHRSSSSSEKELPREEKQEKPKGEKTFSRKSTQPKQERNSLPSSPWNNPASEAKGKRSKSFSHSKLTIFNREGSQRIIAPPITIDPKPITKSPRDIHSQENEKSYSSSEKSASEELKSDIVKNIKQVSPFSFTFLSKQDAIIHNPSGNLSGKVFKDSNKSSSSSEEQPLSFDTDQKNAIENFSLPVSQKNTSSKVPSKRSSEKGSSRGAHSVSSLAEEKHFFEVVDLPKVDKLTIEKLNFDQQKLLKELSEQLDSHSIIQNNPPTPPRMRSKL